MLQIGKGLKDLVGISFLCGGYHQVVSMKFVLFFLMQVIAFGSCFSACFCSLTKLIITQIYCHLAWMLETHISLGIIPKPSAMDPCLYSYEL